jgi:hypothetical protein
LWYLRAQRLRTPLLRSPSSNRGEDVEDDDEEEYSPLSDLEYEKLYRNADERESYELEAPVPIGRL